MSEVATGTQCESCQQPIYSNDPTVVFPASYTESKVHMHHLNCWLKKYRDEGGE